MFGLARGKSTFACLVFLMADFAVKRRTITQSRPIFRRILLGATSGPLAQQS